MKNQLKIKSSLLALGLAVATQTGVQAQTFSPIALTTNSYTQAIVIPVDWTYKLNAQSLTTGIDDGPSLQTDTVAGFPTYYSLENGNALFEVGLNRSSATASNTWGMPPGGSTLVSAGAASHVFQIPYWTNWNSNCICLGNYVPTGTYNSQPLGGGPYVAQDYTTNVNLALMNNSGGANTTAYTALSLLVTGGGSKFGVNVNYADGTTQYNVAFGIPNWFNAATLNASVVPSATWAYTGACRCTDGENGNNFTVSSGVTSGTRLWSVDLALSDSASAPTNLNFYYVSGGNGNLIFAISGSTNAADNQTIPNTGPLTGPFAPVVVSGFNAGGVIANSPQTLAGLKPLTATMDNGTNLAGGANTWFEIGWDQAAPTNGFPAHGSILQSSIYTNRFYQMPASYHQPMSILIDTNHQLANITPITPLAYTAISLLNAGASIGAANVMTNFIILQHQDGVNESNIFFGYDWFNTTQPVSYNAGERCNIGSATSTSGREVQNLDSGDPRLFESEFGTFDTTPITNIQVGFLQSPAVAATTYIIALSGTTNYVPIVLGTNTLVQNVYAGQTAVFNVAPSIGIIQNAQWQVTDGLTFTNNLHPGATGTGSTLSMTANTAGTLYTLTIANVSASDTGNNTYSYTLLASNQFPSTAQSALMPLTLLVSTNANVVAPGDPTLDFFGSPPTLGEAFPSPAGLQLFNVDDGTLTAYLNYGTSGNTAGFVGPVGITVTPSLGATVVNALRFVVAGNAAICDPADFSLDGSNNGGQTWVNIVPDRPLALSNIRNANSSGVSLTGPVNLTNNVLQEVDFNNTTAYISYRVTVQNVKNYLAPTTFANSMQIAEIQFLGTPGPVPPTIVQQPVPPVETLPVGGIGNWTALANGGNLNYQWYSVVAGITNFVRGANAATFSTGVVTTNLSGTSYFVEIGNQYGFTNSALVTLEVSTNPLSSYVDEVLFSNAPPIAFLPLNDGPDNGNGNNGTAAVDIIGGHDGVYNNTVLQLPGFSASNNFSAEFGTFIDTLAPENFASTAFPQDNYVGNISGINFATPTNTDTNFSVEAWVNLSTNPIVGSGIVAQGFGGNEQFALDTGGTGGAFRFYFRNAATNAINVSGNIAPSNNVWYHVVGVVSESNNVSSDFIYINGALAASNGVTYSNAAGLLATNTPIVVGARKQSSFTNYNFQLFGRVADVAIYSNALTSSQILAHYVSAALPPEIILQTSPQLFLQAGVSFTESMSAAGAPTLTYQWYFVSTNNVTNLMAGQTNTSFTISNAQAANSGEYYCVASNAFGTAATASGVVTVVAPSSPYISIVVGDSPIALWRLDEGPDNGNGNDGTIAYDTVGGHDGFYTNVVLQQQGYSANDTDDYSTLFGVLHDPNPAVGGGGLYQDNCVTGISGINFAAATNLTTNLSVEAWVYLNSDTLAGAGIISKGFGGGGEEFALDTGGTANAFRFYFRNASSASVTTSPNIVPALATWTHVVGVLYESNNVNLEYLYTNGVLASSASTTYSNATGLFSDDTAPVVIGARSSASTTNYNLQLVGYIANAAVYNYALTGAQVQNHYLASGVAPIMRVQPTNVLILQNSGVPAVFYSSAFGTSNAFSPLVYQWQINGVNVSNGRDPVSGSTAVISGANTPTLTISNVTTADNGEQIDVVVTNLYGNITSSSATLSVASGAPTVAIDVPTSVSVLAGTPLTLSATFTGTVPITNQWTYNGHPLSNGGRVSGATSNVLTIGPTLVGDSGTYQLQANNSVGSGASSQAAVTVQPFLGFFGSGSGWSLNGSAGAGYVSSNVLELTDGGGSESRSSFYDSPMYVGAFQASFIYQDVAGRGYENDADGTCFVVQNDPRGAAALGGGGGSLGYSGITPSVAAQFNLYQGFGVFLETDGAIYTGTSGGGNTNFNTLPLNIATGDEIQTTITYLNGLYTINLEDLTISNHYTYSMTYAVNVPAVLGTNVAYVGITGADGGTASTQQVSNFQFISLLDVAVQEASGNLVLSWPQASGAYQLQANTSLANVSGWVNVVSPVVVTNNLLQVTVPISSQDQYFRLQLQ